MSETSKGEREAGKNEITEPVTVWRGTSVECEFDGKSWTYDAEDPETGERKKEEHGAYNLDDLAEEEARSLAATREHRSQSDVSPSYGRSVQFKNEGSEQAKLFREKVNEKLRQLGERPYYEEEK